MSKVRVIKGGHYPVYGIALPKEIAIFVKDINYEIEFSDTMIILTSGCSVETIKKEARGYNFEDVRI